jgi:serpin B
MVFRTPGGSTLARDEESELKHEKEQGNPVFTLSKGGLYCTTSDSEEITLGTLPARVVASEGSIFRVQLFERKEQKEMKKARILVVALAVYLGAVTISNEFGSEVAGPGEVVFAQENAAPEKQVAKGNTEFALDLYGKLKDDKKGENIFFSPFSISSALAMTYAGARGNTAKQMADVLHFDLKQKKLHPAFAALTGKLNIKDQKGIELNIANALWAQEGYKFLDEFVALNNKNYGAGLKDVDFKEATEEARQTINKWVEKQTKKKIKNLFKPGVLGPLTRLVLTNAIYFKGDWVKKFDKRLTKNQNFFVTANKKVRTPMMTFTQSSELEFNYTQTENAQILELPYKGDKLSMVILLPKKVDRLSDLEKRLSADSLNKWLSQMREREVKVYLPKFKMTCEFALKRTLEYMGMPDAFVEGKADFSGMNGNRNLFIDAVVHKAFVDVNEEGTEAAAATGVEVAEGISKPPPVFRADHPFLFLIRDKETDSILFMGRVVNPKARAGTEEEYKKKKSSLKNDDVKGHYNLGAWCKKKGLEKEAVELFKKALELDPNNEQASQKMNESGYYKHENKWLTEKEIKAKGLYKYEREESVRVPAKPYSKIVYKKKIEWKTKKWLLKTIKESKDRLNDPERMGGKWIGWFPIYEYNRISACHEALHQYKEAIAVCKKAVSLCKEGKMVILSSGKRALSEIKERLKRLEKKK